MQVTRILGLQHGLAAVAIVAASVAAALSDESTRGPQSSQAGSETFGIIERSEPGRSARFITSPTLARWSSSSANTLATSRQPDRLEANSVQGVKRTSIGKGGTGLAAAQSEDPVLSVIGPQGPVCSTVNGPVCSTPSTGCPGPDPISITTSVDQHRIDGIAAR